MTWRPRLLDALILLGLASGGLLLFIDGPDTENQRLTASIWNFGHIPLFALLAVALLRWLPLQRLQPAARNAGVLGLCLLLGLLVEILQARVGRTFSWLDLAYDGAGAALVVVWLQFQRQPWLRLTLCAVILLASAAKPALVIADVLTAHRQFPVLADFSTALEQSRFSGSARYRQLQRPRALAVQFAAERRFSTLSLEHFPRDWRRYEVLEIDVENPAAEALLITCRIHDAAHERRGFAHDDRFNRRLVIEPGRTVLRIALQEVAAAPVSRRLLLSEVVDLSCFASNLKQPHTLLIYRIVLR